MTATKFDIDNLPDLKIRVANAQESERAQRAFFALGVEWFHGGQIIQHTDRNSLVAYFNNEINLASLADFAFDKHRNTEITLEQLEALAAEKQSSNIQTSLAELRAVQDDASWGEFEPGELERARREAQSRYEAALEYMSGVFDLENISKMHFKALRIAAGLEQITQNTDTKKDNQ